MKILIVSPSIPASGNLSTVSRIGHHLSSMGIDCLLSDTTSIKKEESSCFKRQLQQFIAVNKITGILLIHAFKIGRILLCSKQDAVCDCRDFKMVPFGVIFGGTDLNLDIHDSEKKEVIEKVMEVSNFCVAFNEALRDIAVELSPGLKVYIQPQAVDISDVNCNFPAGSINGRELQKKEHYSRPNVFVMVTGIRPVKDPVFLLDAFSKWSHDHRNQDLRLLVIGPVLDKQYGEIFFEKLESLYKRYEKFYDFPKDFPSCFHGIQGIEKWNSSPNAFPVLYVPPLSQSDLNQMLQTSRTVAIVNSSESEGMSAAVLEAMANKIPVIARDNAGNKSLITENITGLLFNSPEDFVRQAKRLLQDLPLQKALVKGACDMLREKHSMEGEKSFYSKLCTQFFNVNEI